MSAQQEHSPGITQDTAFAISELAQHCGTHSLCTREGRRLHQEIGCGSLRVLQLLTVKPFTLCRAQPRGGKSPGIAQTLTLWLYCIGRGRAGWRAPPGGGSYWRGPGKGLEHRYHSSGHQLHFPPGWPCHGLPAGVPHPPILAKVQDDLLRDRGSEHPAVHRHAAAVLLCRAPGPAVKLRVGLWALPSGARAAHRCSIPGIQEEAEEKTQEAAPRWPRCLR